MKIFIIVYLLFSFFIFPQDMKRRHDPMEKIEELKKIKLIETLNLDEETTLKFFSRRNTHQQKMQKIDEAMDQNLVDIEKELEDNGNSERLNSLINDYLQNDKNKTNERNFFLSSLNDILSKEQIGKLLVFEKKFRAEIKNILWRERRKMGRN